MRHWITRLAATVAIGCAALPAAANTDIPGWLTPHVGLGEGQIAPIVLDRARDLYHEQVSRGRVRNGCYMAMDATRPSTSSAGTAAQRYYVICEAEEFFWAVSSGYGSGRDLPGADFSNGRECAQNFSNALGSNLTMGGSYLTAEARTSFKGYFTQGGQSIPFNRTFLVFDGMGETANARDRAIGGHMATFLRWQCRRNDPDSAYADDNGFVPFGRLVDYTSGRSNGCTTWSDDVSQQIISLVEDNRTTLYIYPESRDIAAVAAAVQSQRPLADEGLYWNASCLRSIGAPQFWPKDELEPVIAAWRQSLPARPRQDLPICE